jgi:hypothetical protein
MVAVVAVVVMDVWGVQCALQLRRLVRHPYARSPLSCRPLLVFMRIICSTPTSNMSQTPRASYWYRHQGASRRSTDYELQALEQVRDLTLRPVLPRLRVCVR